MKYCEGLSWKKSWAHHLLNILAFTYSITYGLVEAVVASHSHLFKLSSPKHKHKLAFVYLNPYDYSITAWMPISRGIFESRGGIPLYQRSLPWWWTPGSEQAWRENGHVIHAAFWGLLISRRGHKSHIIITHICIYVLPADYIHI